MSGTIKVGVAGWSYKDWQGIVYPESLNPKSRVGYLAQFFNLIEINSSFYGHIRPTVGKQSCRIASGVNLKFTFVLPQMEMEKAFIR